MTATNELIDCRLVDRQLGLLMKKCVAVGPIYGHSCSENDSNNEETAMPRSAPTPDVKLTDDEHEHIFALIHKGQHSARVITRARILSKLDSGHCH